MNTKQIGNIGLAQAILYFTKQAIPVLLPLNDSQKYDLAIDKGGILFKVEVKTTKQITSGNIPTVSVRSTGGSSLKTYHTVIDSDTDYLYVYHTVLNKSWLIPVIDLHQRSQINLSSIYDKYLLVD